MKNRQIKERNELLVSNGTSDGQMNGDSKFHERKRRGRERETDYIFKKLLTVKISNLVKTLSPQIQESQQIPRRRNMKKVTIRNIIINLLKINDEKKVLTASREQAQITQKSRSTNDSGSQSEIMQLTSTQGDHEPRNQSEQCLMERTAK